MPPQQRGIGADVSDLMPVGSDVSSVMGSAPRTPPKVGQEVERSWFGDAWEAVKAIPDVARNLINEPAATIEGFGEGALEGAKGVAPTAARVIPALAGGAIGTALLPGAGTVMGASVGGLIGSALGAGAGEIGGQLAEGRDELNLTQAATQTVLGAVPIVDKLGKAGRLAQGALLGGAGAAGTELAEGRMPGIGDVVSGALLGGAFGTIAEGLRPGVKPATQPDLTPPPAAVTPSPVTTTAPAVTAKVPDLNDEMNRILAGGEGPSGISVAPDGPTTVNASGGGLVGSAEENARNAAMKAGGQRFVILDRGGNARPSTVDGGLTIKQGETFGTLNADGTFNTLDTKGGATVPKAGTLAPETGTPDVGQINDGVNLKDTPPVSDTHLSRLARAQGEPLPPSQKLTQERIDGEQKFLERAPEPYRKGMQEVIEANNHFEHQRRGVQSNERTQAMADSIVVERNKQLPRGTALNAEETTALGRHVVSGQDRITELAKKFEAGTADEWDMVKLLQAKEEQTILTANYLGARAETGRALQAHKLAIEALKTGETLGLEKALQNPAVRENLKKFAKEWAALGDDAARFAYLRSLEKAGTWDNLRGIFYSGILSGPKTHIRNFVGNTTNLVLDLVNKPAALAADMAQSAITGAPRQITLGEVKSELLGGFLGVQKGLDDALFALKNGYTRNALSTFDVPRVEMDFKVGGTNVLKPLNYVGRALEASDQLFYGIAYNKELYKRLHAKAVGEASRRGITGADKSRFIKDRLGVWTIDTPKDVREATEAAAKRLVFKEDPGKFVQSIMNVKEKGGTMGRVLDLIVPFIRTPANLIRQGIEMTPAGVLTKQFQDAAKQGGREGAEAWGRMATGTVLGTLAFWAANDRISGSGPKDPEQRALLMKDGWRPNSVKIPLPGGDQWVDYSSFTPLAIPMFAVANAVEKAKESGTGIATEDLGTAVGAALAALQDQSFLAGLSDFNAGMSDPTRYGQRMANRMAQSVVPLSGALRGATQVVDPTVRDPKTIGESVKTILPGASTSVAPKIGIFGEEIQREGTALERGASPFARGGKTGKDPLIVELNRLGVTEIGAPPEKLEKTAQFPKRELTLEERKQFGQAVEADLRQLTTKVPRWKSLDEDVQRNLIQQTASRARERVRRQIRARDVQLSRGTGR